MHIYYASNYDIDNGKAILACAGFIHRYIHSDCGKTLSHNLPRSKQLQILNRRRVFSVVNRASSASDTPRTSAMHAATWRT